MQKQKTFEIISDGKKATKNCSYKFTFHAFKTDIHMIPIKQSWH